MNHRLHKNNTMNDLNQLTQQAIGIAINIHKTLGPGFGETIYKRVLFKELQNYKLKVQAEFPIMIIWKDQVIGKQKVDLLVNDTLIIELKAQTQIEDIHLQQLLSYLKASKISLGLVLNFGAKILQIKRVINSANSDLQFCDFCDTKKEVDSTNDSTSGITSKSYHKTKSLSTHKKTCLI